MYQTIPDNLLDRLQIGLPHLSSMIATLRRMRHSRQAIAIEKHLANNAMLAPACDVLSGHELNQLSKCIVGQKFGGGDR